MDRLSKLKNVFRPSYSYFVSRHILKQTPVVIKGLFEGQEIETLNTKARLRKRLDGMPVLIRREYYSDFRMTGSMFASRTRSSTVGKYLDLLRQKPRTDLVVTEQPTPSELSSLFQVPDICRYRHGEDGIDGVFSEFFLAGRGNVAHLHFDWDLRHVLLHQVFGRKRICLIAPRYSALLDPLFNTSLLNLERLDRRTRLDFLRSVMTSETVLSPGETLYIPALMWHHVEYLDTSMSVSLRFGRNRIGRAFQEWFHPNMYLQNIAWKALRDPRLSGVAKHAVNRILTEFVSAPLTGYELYRRMQRVFEEVYDEYCTDSLQADCWYTRDPLIDRQMKLGIRARMFYSRPQPEIEHTSQLLGLDSAVS